jgi:hypothetical protein
VGVGVPVQFVLLPAAPEEEEGETAEKEEAAKEAREGF